jgi:hypothetical protein
MAVGAIVARILTQYSDKGTKAAIKDISKMEKRLGEFSKKAVKSFAVVAAATGALFVKLGKDSVQAAIKAQAEQNRLTQILLTTNGATLEQIAILDKQAQALENLGVVSAGNIKVAQAQLATFDLQASTIQKLTPAILDYVTAEKGATASAEEFKSMTNGLAQALQGNFASLTRTGFVLDEATKKQISLGTETERAEALVKVLSSTYEGFNKALRNTPEGRIQAIRNSFENIKTTIGANLLPFIDQFVTKIEQDVIPAINKWLELNGAKLVAALQTALNAGIEFGRLLAKIFKFVASNINVFAKLGAVIVAALFGAKVAAATAGFIRGIKAIITIMKALRTVSLGAAAATALATGGISAATGAAAFGAALVGIGFATKKFSSSMDKNLDAGKFKFKAQTFDFKGGGGQISTLVADQKKLNNEKKKELTIEQKIINAMLKKYGLTLMTSEIEAKATAASIDANLKRQAKIAVSPTVSLATQGTGAKGGGSGISTSTTPQVQVNIQTPYGTKEDFIVDVSNNLKTKKRRSLGGGGGGTLGMMLVD